MKIEGSGSISRRHGSADPDPHQNVMDPQHWNKQYVVINGQGKTKKFANPRKFMIINDIGKLHLSRASAYDLGLNFSRKPAGKK
jgi:hypothetical protein